MVTLGNTVTDTITGFTGVAVSRTVHLYGCVRIGVEASALKDGKPLLEWFDEQRVDKDSTAVAGGPSREDTSSRDCPA